MGDRRSSGYNRTNRLFIVNIRVNENLVIKPMVAPVKDDGLDGESDGGTSPDPDEVGVLCENGLATNIQMDRKKKKRRGKTTYE
jgi:hypothetical protein